MSQFMILLVWVAKATALLLLAGGLTMALRRAPAGARYVVWLATLVTLLVIPAISSWSPIPLRVLPAMPAAAPAASIASLAEPISAQPKNSTTAATETPSANVSTPAPTHRVYSAVEILFAGWAVVVAVIMLWLVLAALAVRRIVGRSVTLNDDSWLHPMYDVADRLGLENAPRVVMSSMIEMPFACGVTRSTIVLPRSAEQWSDERRRVVLFHELAHIRRRDLVGHTLGRLVCALYWFHPLVWSAAKRLRAESERACDDLVLACGGARPSEYANHLLEIVTSIRMQGAPATALPMANRKEFEGRMLAILDPGITRAPPSRTQSVALALGLGALAFTLAAVTPAARRPDVTPATNVSTSSPSMVPSDTPRAGMSRTYTRTATMATSTAVNTIMSQTTKQVTSVAVNGVAISRADARADARAYAQPDWNFSMSDHDRRELKQRAQVDTVLLARVLRTDKDAIVRKSAAWVLQGHPEGVPLLIERLKVDVDASVREMAAWGLESEDTPEIAAALGQALKTDKSAEVRATAAWALGHEGQADAATLEAALADEERDVRERALWAIGQHRFAGAATKVVPLLKDDEKDIRLMAAWVLGELRDSTGIPALRESFARESDSETAQAEFRSLLLMGDRSPELIDRAMKSPDPELRADAVRMLAGAGMRTWPWPWPWPEPRPEP